MSDEIVRRLLSQKRDSIFLNESSRRLYEDPNDKIDITGGETPDEFSQDDIDEEPYTEDSEDDIDSEGEERSDDDGQSDDSPEESSEEYVNPLDNPYAVKYTLGDEVSIVYTNGTKTELQGVIEGYDKEGFYRIKWDNGFTTNGFTDIAIMEFVTSVEESRCICGSTEFYDEDNMKICDNCGRPIKSLKETKSTLTLADESRPKGKKLIRSEAHPVSTASKPSIEESKDSETSELLQPLYNLENKFWTRTSEMIEDIEELGYEVLDSNSEYIIISATDDEEEDYEFLIYLLGTSRTMKLDLDRIRELL